MRLIWINILAVVIAISSLVVERPSIQADFSIPSSLSSIPHLDSDILRNDSQTSQQKSIQIAQDFIAIVVIAEATDANHGFLHYLTVYNLKRRKDFFLIV